MAKNITQLSTASSLADSAIIYGGTPDAGNPYGFSDRKITKVNFLQEIQAEVDQNITDIATNAADIVTLQAQIGANVLISALTAKTTQASGADALWTIIAVKVNSGTVTSFKIGTSDGDDDILPNQTSMSTQYAYTINKSFDNDDIYFEVAGANIDIKIYRTINQFS